MKPPGIGINIGEFVCLRESGDETSDRLTDVETGSAWLMCTACDAAYLSLPQVTQVP